MEEICQNAGRSVLELRGLEVECILGDLPAERVSPGVFRVDIDLELDGRASSTDSLECAADYVAICNAVRERLAAAKCRLLERAARIAAETCLAFPGVASAAARVEKRGSVPGLDAAAARFFASSHNKKEAAQWT